MERKAVDQIASSYWTDYFKDSGYGALWVRKMPMRIKAALQKDGHYTSGLEPEFSILGHAITADAVKIDGVARAVQHGASGEPVRVARSFYAEFDHKGNLHKFTSIASP